MRDSDRIDRIGKELIELWKLYPDFRFLQMIINIVEFKQNKPMLLNYYHIEDDIFEKKLKEFKNSFMGIE